MDNMGHHEEEDTILSLSLGSPRVPPTTRTRHPQNPMSLDASLALSVSSDVVDVAPPPPPPKAPLQSSSHSTVSTLISVKRERDDHHEYIAGEEEEEERGSSSRASDEDADDGSVRKKLRLTKEQYALLEERFKEHSTLNPKQKLALAKRLNLRQRQVEVWFQNRRARTKLKQTEADCELLKRCYETLTDENRRLQKEVNELKAIKYVAAPLYMQLPAAALTVCPSCERVTGPEVGNSDAKEDGGGGGGGGGGTGPFRVGAPKAHFFNPFTRSAAC